VIVAPSLAAGIGVLTGPLGEVMMDARTPVLVARAETLAPGRPAAVAWDGSLEAGRAVRAAMPLLKEASRVAIVQQIEEIDASAGAAADPERLKRYLAGHDITVETTIETRERNVGSALLLAAERYGAELLVAGAYGHSRVGEALVGGATRAFLAARSGPHVLLAH
jgi:nucleotide-binding universal stress UspA family protein